MRHARLEFIVGMIFIISFGIISYSAAFAASYSVSMPDGTSVPGCEESNQCFVPYSLTINSGDKVTWYNDDSAAHTVTSGPNIPDGNFDSSLFMAGTTFSVTLDEEGEYPYFCMVHPWMTGIVIVESSSIQYTMGVVAWDQASYNIGDTGTVTLQDPDLNTDTNSIQLYNVVVSSDSYPVGVEIIMIETGNNSGIFVGFIDFGTSTTGSSLKVSPGDKVYAEYRDTTLPSGGDIIIGDAASIKSQEPQPSPPPSGTDVTMPSGTSVPGCENSNSCFVPSVVSVAPGKSLTWYNADSAAHTVTSGNPAYPSSVGYEFDSGLFLSGSTFTHVFDKSDTIDYFCIVHPWMQGTVIVGSGSSTPPPAPIPTGPAITVTTDKSSYKSGNIVRISGEVRELLSGFPVTLQVIGANGNIVALEQVTVTSFKKYSKSLVDTDSPVWGSTGTYTVKVLYGTESRTAQTTFYFTSSGSSAPPKPAPEPEPFPVPSKPGTDVTMPAGTSVPGCEETNSCFIPSTLRVSTGKTVTWYNADSAAHTVTSGHPSNAASVGAQFDSSLFMAGSTFSHKFQSSGTFDYFCIVHPWMSGQIIVDGGGTSGSLSISTDKSSYGPGDLVNIQAKVSGSSRANVAVSVTDSSGDNILSRTISTGSSGFGDLDFKLSDNSNTGTYNVVGTASIGGSTQKDSTSFLVKSQAGRVSIVSLEATDQQGNTVSSFSKGKLSFAKVILSSDSSVSSLVTVNLFDSELTSLGIGSFKTTLPSGESEMTLSFFIPDDASSGTANIYANVFSDWPSNGGIPLTGESSVSVTIR